MPASKNPHLRYKVLNDCFRNRSKPYWSTPNLIEELRHNDIAAKPRTVEKDIEDMRHDPRLGYHAPIKWSMRYLGYYYSDPEYSIDRVPLSPGQRRSLMYLRDLVESSAYKEIESLKEAPSALERIIRHTDRDLLERWPQLPTLHCKLPNTVPVIQHASMLLLATSDMVVVHLRVTEAGKNEEDYDLHPYRLDHDSEHWYIIGLRDDTHIHVFVQLEYIGSLAPSTRTYIPFHNPYADVIIPFTPGETQEAAP